MESLKRTISEGEKAVAQIRTNAKMAKSDEYITNVLSSLAKAYKYQIHSYLRELGTDEAEAEVREHIKYIVKYILPILEARIQKHKMGLKALTAKKLTPVVEVKLGEEKEILRKYLEIYDDYYALVACRSMEHFAMYMEFDQPEKDKVWKYNLNCFHGFWYYANKMVLDHEYKMLEKQCPVGYGKCSHPLTNVLTAQGYRLLGDIRVGDLVYAMEDNKPVIRRVTHRWDTRKPQVKIKIRSGAEVVCSPEHRLYTDKGYKMCKDITTDDYLYEICAPLDFGYKIDDDELFFVACMIFEGHCKRGCYRFTQQDNDVLDKFLAVLSKWGVEYSLRDRGNAYEVRILSGNGKITEILQRYGIIDHLAYDKRLPKQFFEMCLKQRYDFIGIMLATDGWINSGESQCGISLANEGLIQDIQRLLGTCGIYSSYVHKLSKCNGKEFDSYSLAIPDEFITTVSDNCYCYYKKDRLKERIDRINSKDVKPYSNNVNYPKSVVSGCKELRKIKNKSWVKTSSFKRQWINDFSERTGLLADVATNDFVWQQVKSVEHDDTLIDMVDIEVEGAHNFIANGIVSHNSYSDIVMMAFIFGNDINADILKVTGNPQMVADGVEKLVKYMLMPRYAKVFPQFEEYNCDSSQMFTSLERGSTRNPGRFLLRGSKKGCSFLMVNKDTPVDGGRFMWRFYDDITRSKDKANIVAHEKDISMYVSGWKKRKYDDERSFEVFSGTTYNIQDFLSYAKRTHGGDNAIPSPINEFTSVNPVFKSVFVCVPKLDKNDNVTFPARYSRQEAIQDRANDYETFMAMEMQTPVPLKGNPFAYGKIQTYSTIPREPSETDVCIAALDPARTGANYVSMPIMEEVNGKYYLKDVVFELRPMDEMYGEIIEKIVKHKIIKLHIERNTDTSVKCLLDKMLCERGINCCEITEVYSTQQKDRKIANAEAAIRNGMVFPEFGMYAQSSPMGEFMKWFTGYSYVTKNAFDDSVDSLAIFADKFILGKTKTAKAIVLNMRH